MVNALRKHWPEYLMEAAGLGLFMMSACAFGALLWHPNSPVSASIQSPLALRALMGIAMGLTAVGLIYSPWGKRSGAHLNPSITLVFFRCGRIPAWDALFYVLAQFAGGAIGVLASALVLREIIADPSVNFVITTPGRFGTAAAFVAESAISFILMLVVLRVSNVKRLNGYTGLFAGALIAIFITLEAPVSGTSMNPARSLGSALSAQVWTALWIYFAAPTLGMLAASLAYEWRSSAKRVLCAKLHHQNTMRCIFRCNYGDESNVQRLSL